MPQIQLVMENEVCLTLKFTPHTCPRHPSVQMLEPNENYSQRAAGCGGGVSTKRQSPQGGLQVGSGEGIPHGFAVTAKDTEHKGQGTLKGTPLARSVSAAEKDTVGVFSWGLLEFHAPGSLVSQEVSKFGHTLLPLQILGWTQIDTASPRVTQMEAVSQSPEPLQLQEARRCEPSFLLNFQPHQKPVPENGFAAVCVCVCVCVYMDSNVGPLRI